jgi:hypothetical protein
LISFACTLLQSKLAGLTFMMLGREFLMMRRNKMGHDTNSWQYLDSYELGGRNKRVLNSMLALGVYFCSEYSS